MFRDNRGRKQLNAKERASIIALTHNGMSITAISNALGIARATVVLWQKRHFETGDVERKYGSGRPVKTTREEDARMKSAAEAKPITTAQEIAGNKIYIK